MSYTPKPGDGSLFKNKYKTEDKHPGMKGYIIAHRDIKAGEKIEIASWKKNPGNGEPFLSLRLSDIRATADNPTPVSDAPPQEVLDDEVPF